MDIVGVCVYTAAFNSRMLYLCWGGEFFCIFLFASLSCRVGIFVWTRCVYSRRSAEHRVHGTFRTFYLLAALTAARKLHRTRETRPEASESVSFPLTFAQPRMLSSNALAQQQQQ